MNIKTRTYADGTTATGPAPLPEQSPLEQEYLAMRSAQHDHPACAIFRGGRCTCDASVTRTVETPKVGSVDWCVSCDRPASGCTSDCARRALIAGEWDWSKLPRHKFWGAGEPDCPQELKGSNGELHTMRCKVCGDGWRKNRDVCFGPSTSGAAPSTEALPERCSHGVHWENRCGACDAKG